MDYQLLWSEIASDSDDNQMTDLMKNTVQQLSLKPDEIPKFVQLGNKNFTSFSVRNQIRDLSFDSNSVRNDLIIMRRRLKIIDFIGCQLWTQSIGFMNDSQANSVTDEIMVPKDIDPLYQSLNNRKNDIFTLILTSSSQSIQKMGQNLTMKMMIYNYDIGNHISHNICVTVQRYMHRSLFLSKHPDYQQCYQPNHGSSYIDNLTKNNPKKRSSRFSSVSDSNFSLPSLIDDDEIELESLLLYEHHLKETNRILARILRFLIVLVQNDLNCLIFLSKGICQIVYKGLQNSELQIITLSILLLQSIYRSLSRSSYRFQSEYQIESDEKNMTDSVNTENLTKRNIYEILYHQISGFKQNLVDNFCQIFISNLKKFPKSSEDFFPIFALFHFLSILPQSKIIQFLIQLQSQEIDSNETIIRYDDLCVKIWSIFDSSYQVLLELTEIKKQFVNDMKKLNLPMIQNVKLEDIETAIIDAHNVFALASFTLKNAIEIALLGMIYSTN
jgi:hypothetical protein